MMSLKIKIHAFIMIIGDSSLLFTYGYDTLYQKPYRCSNVIILINKIL